MQSQLTNHKQKYEKQLIIGQQWLSWNPPTKMKLCLKPAFPQWLHLSKELPSSLPYPQLTIVSLSQPWEVHMRLPLIIVIFIALRNPSLSVPAPSFQPFRHVAFQDSLTLFNNQCCWYRSRREMMFWCMLYHPTKGRYTPWCHIQQDILIPQVKFHLSEKHLLNIHSRPVVIVVD